MTITYPRDPVSGALKDLLPLDFKLVRQNELEPLWDELVHSCHYLGHGKMPGAHIKYLVLSGNIHLCRFELSRGQYKTKPQRQLHRLAGIRSNTLLWTKRPEFSYPPYKGRGPHPKKKKPTVLPQPVAKIAADPALRWEAVSLGEGAKGPIICWFARFRVIEHRDGVPGKELWLLLRRNSDGEIKAMLSNVFEDMSLKETLRTDALDYRAAFPGQSPMIWVVFMLLLPTLRILATYVMCYAD